MRAIQDLLSEWARWHLTEGGIGYPTRTPFDRLRGSAVPSAMITDEDALAVDAAVAALGRKNPRQKALLVGYYIQRRSMASLGRSWRVSRWTLSRRLRAAETAVEASLGLSEGIDEDY